MSISSEITRINQNIASAYTACNNKGATMPQTQNSANLAATITSITTGGGATLIPKTITENGTYAAEDDNADGYSEVTVAVQVSVEEKYINFIDYDGTVLYSWTEEELQEATELPPLPSHTGLNSVGWNWSLADIKSQGTSIYVGALYEPSDGKMKMIIRFYENDDFAVGFSLAYETPQTNVVIDWGDGSTEELHASSISHIYSKKGTYEVKISSSSDEAVVLNSISNISNRMIHVVLNNNIVVRRFLEYAYFLETLIISPSYRDDHYYRLSTSILYRLKAFILPNIITGTFGYTTCEKISIYGEITNYLNSLFRNSYIPYFVISRHVTSIPNNFLEGNAVIHYIFIPKNITSIGSGAFRNNTRLMYIDLSDYNDSSNIPQLTNANAFEIISSNAVFQFRNQSMLDAFTQATNWSTYANQFEIGGKFGEVTT